MFKSVQDQDEDHLRPDCNGGGGQLLGQPPQLVPLPPRRRLHPARHSLQHPARQGHSPGFAHFHSAALDQFLLCSASMAHKDSQISQILVFYLSCISSPLTPLKQYSHKMSLSCQSRRNHLPTVKSHLVSTFPPFLPDKVFGSSIFFGGHCSTDG